MNSIKIFFGLLAGAILGLFQESNFVIKQVSTENPSSKLINRLQQFEKSFVYPFSAHENFTIEHGKNGDYFAFFKKLGQPYYYIATPASKTASESGEIAGAICLVLRTLKDKNNNPLCAWYVCDLKVDQKYQGQHLPTTIVKKIGLPRFIQCPRGFAITMNPASGEPRAASIFKQHGPVKLETQTLNLYNLSYEQAIHYQNKLKELYVYYGYMRGGEWLGTVTTTGAKDYVIANNQTGKTYPWELVHIKPGVRGYNPEKGATHMVCSIEGTDLDKAFKKLFKNPSSTAQIISYGMEGVDFNFLTSDQI